MWLMSGAPMVIFMGDPLDRWLVYFMENLMKMDDQWWLVDDFSGWLMVINGD